MPVLTVVVLALVGTSFWLGRKSTQGQEAAREAEAAPALAEADGQGGDDGAVAEAAAPTPPALADGLHQVSVSIVGSLSGSIVREVGSDYGDALAQVSGRLLIWWLDVSRDLRPNDRLHLIYELPPGSEPLIHALRLDSQKLGKELNAYRFHAPGDAFARYYDEEGKELELRLENSPIADYEQVTSLLKDGRKHAGVDFKAPVGTPVTTPFAGVVRRKNFNYRVNGTSVEIEDAKGRKILFLHLSSLEKGIEPGKRLAAGQRVGYSGNTGRSTAPHLHYQLMSPSGRVMDPYDVHKTYRRSMKGEHLAGFASARREMDGQLSALALDEGAAPPSVGAN